MTQDLTDDNIDSGDGLVATSHYLSQYWFISLSSYGVVKPQWVNMQHLTLLGGGGIKTHMGSKI